MTLQYKCNILCFQHMCLDMSICVQESAIFLYKQPMSETEHKWNVMYGHTYMRHRRARDVRRAADRAARLSQPVITSSG